ncbi:hypothetical protein H6G06_00405 [Anabaena sphaerica FACHB-251]|uniref:Uncharacterized protein n=1 Tax=Anabaena sphaerica FACHB-251 TaxID=2692883 RepID=A0A926WD00_9NOST|nr:hypothetical protein [Anabaena sphaerica]MBD2291977.1 hypothetical protein [Anabaena sphaerica FACHB-251]
MVETFRRNVSTRVSNHAHLITGDVYYSELIYSDRSFNLTESDRSFLKIVEGDYLQTGKVVTIRPLRKYGRDVPAERLYKGFKPRTFNYRRCLLFGTHTQRSLF